MSKNYIKNLETGKIELHFSKPEYLALSDELKKEIKRSYLFSHIANAWVSRSIHNHYSAIQTAKKLGFEGEETIGQKLSYEDQLERKAEKAEHRAERYDQYADNANNRGKNLQSELEHYRGDIAFLTQPIIAGHSGSQAFGKRREKIFNRYRKGFEEYRKSAYFQEKAETARQTADKTQLKDPIYLNNRIEECNKHIRKLEKNIVYYEDILYKKNNNEEVPHFYQDKSLEQIQDYLEETMDKIEWQMDKLAFMQNCMDEIGGNKYNKNNIKVGYIVKIERWGKCEIVSTGAKNIKFKILEGGASGGILTDPYAAITEILEAKEETKETIDNPYKIGDILCKCRPADGSIYKAFQVVKVTKTGVKIMEIAVNNGEPLKDQFIGKELVQRKIVKSKFSEFIGVYDGDWQLHKYTA